MEISKVEAASRLLDTAIRLFFEGADAVAVHSLAAASLNIFSDLAEHGGNSWRAHLGDDSKLSAPEAKRVLNSAWNFFKHADRDPDGTLQFEEIDSEHLMFVAILECGDLQTTSCCMQAFQLWYIAAHPDYFPKSESVFLDAMKVFPGLENLSSRTRIRRGHDFLEEHCPPCALLPKEKKYSATYVNHMRRLVHRVFRCSHPRRGVARGEPGRARSPAARAEAEALLPRSARGRCDPARDQAVLATALGNGRLRWSAQGRAGGSQARRRRPGAQTHSRPSLVGA